MVVVMGSFELIIERRKERTKGEEKRLIHTVFPATFKKACRSKATRQIYVNRGSCRDNKLLTLKQFGILWLAALPPPPPTPPTTQPLHPSHATTGLLLGRTRSVSPCNWDVSHCGNPFIFFFGGRTVRGDGACVRAWVCGDCTGRKVYHCLFFFGIGRPFLQRDSTPL